MKNIPIKVKLLGSLIIPIIALLVFSTSLLKERFKVNSEMKTYSKATHLAVKISNLVHETQKERGASAGFLGSKGAKFGDTLRTQRMDTDERYNDLKSFLSTFDLQSYDHRLVSNFEKGMADLEQLSSIRNRVDNLNISVKEEVAYYTNLNTAMLDAVGSIGYLMTDSALAKDLNAYANFLLSKERAGIERAVLSNTFAADKFAPGMYQKLIQLITEQNSYMASFKLTATPAFIDFLNTTVKGKPVDKVNEMRQVALQNGLTGGFGVDAPYWFATITKKINLLKQVENYFSDKILTHMDQKQTAARNSQIFFLGLFIISIISIIVLLYAIIRVVLGNIKKLSKEIINLTEGDGDLTKRLYLDEKNEVGILYDNLNDFISNIDINLSNTLGHVSHNADAVIPLISMVSDMSLSARSSSDMANQVSAASAQMSSTISEISENTLQSSSSVENSLNMAIEGKDIIDQVNTASNITSTVMNELTDQITGLKAEAEKIGNVISVINDIADQTNLLALNAAIEAARAGEAGRGFAVVADEVRKLAEKTQSSTSEISIVVKDIQGNIADAVQKTVEVDDSIQDQNKMIGSASANFDSIVASVEDANSLIGSISAAVEEQSATTTEISQSIEVVARDSNLLMDKSEALITNTNGMVLALKDMDMEFANFTVSNKAVPLIRGKIAHAVFLSNIQQSITQNTDVKVTDHRNCEFGKFYYSLGLELYKDYPEFKQIEAIHEHVHNFGQEVVHATKGHDLETRKDAYTGFQHAVTEFMAIVNKLIAKVEKDNHY